MGFTASELLKFKLNFCHDINLGNVTEFKIHICHFQKKIFIGVTRGFLFLNNI